MIENRVLWKLFGTKSNVERGGWRQGRETGEWRQGVETGEWRQVSGDREWIQVSGDREWKKLHNVELHDFNCSLDVIRVMKEDEMGRACSRCGGQERRIENFSEK